MKWLLGYWLIGCVICGLAWGWHIDRCPNDGHPTAGSLIVGVATWPAAFFAAINSKSRALVCQSERREAAA